MRKTMHALVVVAMAAAVIMPALAAEDAEKTCLKCRVKVLVKTHSRGDVEKFVSYLTDDFRRVDVESGETLSREDLRRVLEWDVALRARIEYGDLSWDGSTVTGVFSETNDLFEILDLEPRRYHATFVFEGDLLREQRIEILTSGTPILEEALGPFLSWASQRRERDLSEIFSDGRMVRTGETAGRWVELLTEWTSLRNTSSIAGATDEGSS